MTEVIGVSNALIAEECLAQTANAFIRAFCATLMTKTIIIESVQCETGAYSTHTQPSMQCEHPVVDSKVKNYVVRATTGLACNVSIQLLIAKSKIVS